MAQAFTPGLKATSSTVISRERELPVEGEILVKVGQKTRASDIVARASLLGDLQILRIPEKMGIEPFEVIKGLKIKEGQDIALGDLVAEHVGLFGLFKTKFESPCAGKVEFIAERTAHVGVRMASKPLELNGYISGTVSKINGGKSVTIESRAALVQGIFGVGGEARGILQILPVSPNKDLEAADIPETVSGRVLVGGMRPSLEALNRARSLGAVGFVTGSIDDQALKGYLGYDLGIALTGDEEVSMTVIITEGFGKMPLSDRVLTLLKRFDGREVSINGATQVRAGAERPEIIICLDDQGVSAEAPQNEGGLTVGSRVRIIRVPYFGEIAEVTELPGHLQRIPTGAEARVLVAKLGDGKSVVVPRANVELI